MLTLLLDSHCGMFGINFMPHGHCYFWRPEIVWSHAISDALIAISYFIIPYGLIRLIKKRPDLRYKNLFLLFGLFIVACGSTHILSIINIWHPLYRLDAVVKIITALASVPTAIILLKILPEAVKIPSISMWEKTNTDLQNQIIKLHEKDRTIEQSREFQFLTDAIPQIIWTADAAGSNNYYNQHWFDYSGMNLEESVGWGWSVILHPGDLPHCIEVWKDALANGSNYEIECRLKRKSDGEYRWHLVRALPMKDENGTITKWFGTCTDVHEFKITEQEGRMAKQRLESVINSAPIALWSIDTGGIYTLSEGKALEGLGVKPGEVVGIPYMAMHAENPDIVENIQKAFAGEQVTDINVLKDKTFETYYNPILNNEGFIDGIVGVSVDITQKKKAEKANELKSQFLANMSHELRTPLNAVIGFAGVLNKTQLDTKQKQYVYLINQAGELLLKLIGDVLDLSKIEEGKFVIEEESFHLKEAINSTLNPYKITASEGGLELSIVFDDRLPEFVIGDKHRINQILVNLTGNALKFTKQGMIQIRIDLLESLENKVRLKFSVADTGIGIPKEKQLTIFDSYTQANSSVQKEFGGSGLGLTIVKQLVILMGGEVHLDSPHSYFSVPLGSCFWFELALDIDKRQYIEKPKESLASFEGKVRVLMAEDNEVNQILARIVMKNIGCEVDFANNGEECLKMLSTGRYNLILMDIQMPVMDGIIASSMIRYELKNNIPIIGLSANVSKEDIARSLQAGMNDHMGKPYSEEQIHKVIKKWTNFSPAEAITNLSYIKELTDDKEEHLSLLDKSYSQAKDYFEKIEASYSKKDWKDLAFICHSYKSSARIVGATKLQLALNTLEQAATDEKEALIPQLYDTVQGMIKKVKKEIELGKEELLHT